MSLELSTTWALVMIRPASSITKPEPVATWLPPPGDPNGLNVWGCEVCWVAWMKTTPGAS
jgi:hypothetical protein